MANAPNYDPEEKINADGIKLVVPSTVTVVGTGGFGAWAAIFSARAGVQRLVLVNPTNQNNTGDPEDIAEREIAIGPFDPDDLGKPKVDVLKAKIAAARPDAQVETHKIEFDPEQHADLLEGIVFAGVSDESVNLGTHVAAKRKGLRCFTGMYSGTKAGTFGRPPLKMPIVKNSPVWVGSAAMSAILAVNAAFVSPFDYYGEFTDDLSLGREDFLEVLTDRGSDI